MFYRLKKGKQRELIQKAITKAGSERKLCRIIHISKGAIHRCRCESCNIPRDRLQKILKFLDIDIEEYSKNILKKFPQNWGQIKGGKILIEKKIEEGTFIETIKRLRKGSSKYMKKWHKDMKEKSPKEYYTWQYERFKKIGRGYAFSLKNDPLPK